MLGLQHTPPGKMRRACPRRAWSFSGSGEITSGAFRSWGEHSSIVYRLLVARTGKSSAVGPDPDKNGVRRDEWASLPRTGLDRHRGSGCPLTPATPPCVRVRTRRFEMVTLTRILQIRETERFKIGRGKP